MCLRTPAIEHRRQRLPWLLFPYTRNTRALAGAQMTSDYSTSKETLVQFMSEKTRATLIGVGGMAR